MSHTSTSPIEPFLRQIAGWLEEDHLTNAQVVLRLQDLGIASSEGSIRRAKPRIEKLLGRPLVRNSAPPKRDQEPSFRRDGDVVEINSGKLDSLPTDVELIQAHGLVPEDWDYDDAVVSWWGNPLSKNYQLKLKLRRKRPVESVFPARVDGVYIAPKRVVDRRKTKGILLYGDQQCPFIDWDIFAGMLKLTKEFQPSMIIDPGDGRDFPSVSHHRTWPAWRAAAQECIDTKYTVDREMRRANESAEMVQFLGNHCIRLASYMLEKAPAVYGITPGCAEDEDRMEEALSIRNLGRLDELGIELVTDEKMAYDQARFMISDQLGVEHGNKTGTLAAVKAQHRKTFGLLMGHTHHQSINHVVNYDHNNAAQVHLAVETGTGAIRDRGIGFAMNPDWVGGGVWVTLHEDGGVHAELITSKNGYLHFRDKRF